MTDTTPMQVTDLNFEAKVLEEDTPVLVDFWAPWCGPCRMVAPVLEELANELAGQVKIAKVNADENPVYAHRYGVQGIPTMVLFRAGQEVDRLVGAMPKPALREWLLNATAPATAARS